MPPVAAGVVWPRRSDVRDAFAPLVADGTVAALQITVEHAFRGTLTPGYTDALDDAAARGALVGHAVHPSPFTWPRDAIAHDWMRRAKAVLARWPVRWLTDHVGCCRADGWHAAPLPLPASRALAQIGRDHLRWLADALQVPVGLENLALAVSADDVLAQPDLVDAIVRPVGGIVLLDLHNLWCQAVNYDLDPIGLLQRWPLDLVRARSTSRGDRGRATPRDPSAATPTTAPCPRRSGRSCPRPSPAAIGSRWRSSSGCGGRSKATARWPICRTRREGSSVRWQRPREDTPPRRSPIRPPGAATIRSRSSARCSRACGAEI